MNKTLIIILFLAFSCASKPGHYQVHRAYVDTVMQAKNTMEKKQLVTWLKEQIKRKENEMGGYRGIESREGRILENHQQREQEFGGRGDANVYEFEKRASEMRMHGYDKKKKFIESELLMLRSMLSERD